MFCNGPPTTSSLSSMPSIVMLPPRPAWPADDTIDRLRLGRIEVGRGSIAGRQKRELEKVAAVERQRLDLAGRDDRTDDRSQRRRPFPRRRRRDLLGHAGNCSIDLHLDRLTDFELNPGHASLRESGAVTIRSTASGGMLVSAKLPAASATRLALEARSGG